MPDLQSKRQPPRESFPVFVSFPKFALTLLFSCSYRLVMRKELGGKCGGGGGGTRTEQFLASPGLYIPSSPSSPFSREVSPPSGEAPSPLSPSSPPWQPWVPQWGRSLHWGRGLCPWEDAGGDGLVGKRRRKDPLETGVCVCVYERERERGKRVSFPQKLDFPRSKGTRCGARRGSAAGPQPGEKRPVERHHLHRCLYHRHS